MKRTDAIKLLELKKADALAKRNEADLYFGDSAAFARFQLYQGQAEAYTFALALLHQITPDPQPQRVRPVVVVPQDNGDWPF